MNVTDQGNQARDKLAGDLKLVIKDAEELLKNTGQQMDEQYQSARARFEATLKSAKNGLSKVEESVVTKARDAAQSTDQYVQDHPWQSIGVSAFVGLLLGFLFGRR